MSAAQAKPDTVMLVYLKSKTSMKPAERTKMLEWLQARMAQERIKLIIE